MAASSSPTLDEIQHRRPDIIAWWINEFGGSAMDENMIHRYLAESPFFDHSTKNGLLFLQAEKNLSEFQLVQDRRRLEENLRRHVGTEYLIVGEPQEIPVPGGAGGGGGKAKSGIWVIRKQDRQKTRAADGRVEDELTTLGTYYAVNENMYQAPSVGDIVGNRLVSAATNLSKFFDTAAKLPTFSPTAGYSYLPHQSRPQTTTGGASSHASPSRSREGSVLHSAATATETQSHRSTSLAPFDSNTTTTNPLTQTTTTTITTPHDSRLLTHSFQTSLEFTDEYADENPLLGEPGHFSFTSSLAAVKKRKAAEEEARALAEKAARAKDEQRGAKSGDLAAVKVEEKEKGPASPPAVMTEAKTALARERRGSKMGERVRRKKSRANVGSIVGVAEGAGG